MGIHMVQVARHRGATVAGLDVTEEKLAEIERLGALPIHSDGFELLDYGIFEGERPTVVVDLLGTTATAAWALGALGMGGRMVVLTTFPHRQAAFQASDMVFRELSILGSRYSYRAQVVEAARLVADGHVQPIIGTVAGPQDVLGLHEQIRSRHLIGRGALNWR